MQKFLAQKKIKKISKQGTQGKWQLELGIMMEQKYKKTRKNIRKRKKYKKTRKNIRKRKKYKKTRKREGNESGIMGLWWKTAKTQTQCKKFLHKKKENK